MCGAATWTVPKVDQNCLERFEIWCCRRIEVISWTDGLKNKDVLQRIAEKKNNLHTTKQKKPNWTRHQFTTLNQQNENNFFFDIYLTFGAWLCMVLKLGRFGQKIRNTWKDLKCGAGEGWRSVGPIM